MGGFREIELNENYLACNYVLKSTHDEEIMKIMMKMKEERIGFLRPLLEHVGGSSRRSLVARRLPSTILHVLLLQGARNRLLRFRSSK